MLRKWEELPSYMQNEEVRKYYDILAEHQGSLVAKRCFDIVFSILLLVVLSPVFLVVSIWIRCDSQGPVFYRQERITQYGKVFRIFKFRTMVTDADRIGTLVTVGNDSRITAVGAKIRKVRLDEIPQLLNILTGDMTFVGTRPEVKKYVDAYTDSMYDTLLLPAGVTSVASIAYKDEDTLLEKSTNPDQTYIQEILPEKMKYNLKALEEFSFLAELETMVNTVRAVL